MNVDFKVKVVCVHFCSDKTSSLLADEVEKVEVCNWQLMEKVPQLLQTLKIE